MFAFSGQGGNYCDGKVVVVSSLSQFARVSLSIFFGCSPFSYCLFPFSVFSYFPVVVCGPDYDVFLSDAVQDSFLRGPIILSVFPLRYPCLGHER